MELKGKTALVTGGAVRVGRAIALELAKNGANIVLHYFRSEKEAKQTVSEITALGVHCTLAQADLSVHDEIVKMTHELVKNEKKVDILVNSASLFFKTPVDTVSEAEWERMMAANLKGPFLLSVQIGKEMIKNKSGKIVNIADWSGFRPYQDYMAYCTSKGGLIALTKALARDLAPHVTVNTVAPGPVLTPTYMSEHEKEAVAKTTAVGHWGKPEDVAHAVKFFIENDFVNGTVLVVDGGRSLV